MTGFEQMPELKEENGVRKQNIKKNIVIAIGSVPKDGGTFTFYRTLRPKLLEQGIDVYCVSVGKSEATLWDNAFADEGCVLLAASKANVKEQSEVFVDWCEKVGVDVVMAINSVAILSALPHLPEKIRVMSRCANAFDHGYRITVACYERLARIVALAPRQIHDLCSDYGVDEGRICLIPNGVAPSLFDAAARSRRGEASALRLGFLGRLEHKQKGVLFLPEILHCLRDNGIDFTLKIAGKGVHRKVLERELKDFIQKGLVEFVGLLPPSDVPDFLGDVDLLLFPSQFEGSPNALLEGVMAGCVPIAWELEGITDFIIKDGQTGFVCPMGHWTAFADRIAELAGDRKRLQQMAEAAAEDAHERFTQSRVVADYVRLINQVMEEPALPWTSRPWSEFRLAPAFENPSWRAAIPGPVKRVLKRCLFHIRLARRYEE